jgi:hypothetical protein
MAIATGTLGAIEQAPKINRDDRGVITTDREWLGYQSDCQAVADTLATPYRIEQYRGPIYRLTTSQPGNLSGGGIAPTPESLVVTVWDLKSTKQRRDLWELPKVRAELLKIVWRDARAQFLADLRALAAGEVIVTHRLDSSGKPIYETSADGAVTNKISDVRLDSETIIKYVATAYGCNAQILREFSDELSRGVDSYLYDTFTLIKKRIGPATATNLLTEFERVNTVFRTTTVLALEPTIPAAIRTNMSGQLGAGYWVRDSDELNQLDANRIEINSQWTYAESYSTFIYGAAA